MNRFMVICAVALLSVSRCDRSPIAGGGASETVAMVEPYGSGIRVLVNGDDPFTVAVKIYNQKFSRFDTGWFRDSASLSDTANEWVLPAPPESALHIFVIDSIGGSAAFFRYVNDSGSAKRLEKKLTRTGEVSGNVTILHTDGNRVPAAGYWVLIPGSPFDAAIGSDGFYTLAGVPEGNYTIEARNAQNSKESYRGENLVVEIVGEQIFQQDITLKK